MASLQDLLDFLNSGATVGTRLRSLDAKNRGSSAGLLGAVANPDAVLGSEPANFASGLLGPMGAVGLGGVMTYHGTPHNVPRYDLSKIGTGEGAQVYGHGMYFAENPQVAKVYKEALGQTEIADPSGKVLFSGGKPGPLASAEARAANWLEYAHGAQVDNPYQFAAAGARRQENPQMGKAIDDILAKWQEAGAAPRKGGNLYAQDLPDEMLPKMLQWDKPLSEQPYIMQQLSARDPKYADKVKDLVGEEFLLGTRGSGKLVNQAVGKGKADADWLSSMGIPGVSYLDAGSRALPGGNKVTVTIPGKAPFQMDFAPSLKSLPEGSTVEPIRGTMNHVVWDQELLNRMIPQAMP